MGEGVRSAGAMSDHAETRSNPCALLPRLPRVPADAMPSCSYAPVPSRGMPFLCTLGSVACVRAFARQRGWAFPLGASRPHPWRRRGAVRVPRLADWSSASRVFARPGLAP